MNKSPYALWKAQQERNSQEAVPLAPPAPVRLIKIPGNDGSTSQVSFRIADGDMGFGDVCAGFTPRQWACELRRRALRCATYRTDMSDYFQHWADQIEDRLQL